MRLGPISTWLCCCALAAGCASSPPPRSQKSPLLGDVMPSFESKTVNGNPLYSSAYHGKAFVVSFVASKCEGCERTLAAAQSAYSNRRELVVVGVFSRDDADAVAFLTNKHGLKFPVVLDQDGSIAKRFQVQAVPRTFVVDAEGRVSWIGGSDMTEDALSSALQAAER